MKTTVEIPEGLFADLKQICAEQGTTLKEMLTAVVAKIVTDNRKKSTQGEGFHLRRASYPGGTCEEGIDPSDWATIRRAIYSGRGE